MERKWIWRGIGIFFALIMVFTALDYGFGYFGVLKTKTVYKAKQDAKREVFEQTQSYVEAKRQEALKLYKEWNQAESEAEKKMLEEIVAHSFANFDEDKLPNQLKLFVYNCKYK